MRVSLGFEEGVQGDRQLPAPTSAQAPAATSLCRRFSAMPANSSSDSDSRASTSFLVRGPGFAANGVNRFP